MRRSTDCLDSKRWRSLTCLDLPVKGLGLRTLRIMATMLRVPVVLAPVHGIKGGIHSVNGRHSVYRQSKLQHAGWLESIDSTTATNAHMGPRKEGSEGYAKDT